MHTGRARPSPPRSPPRRPGWPRRRVPPCITDPLGCLLAGQPGSRRFPDHAVVRDWGLQRAEAYRALAALFNHGLDARDRLLITADSQDLAGPNWRFVGRRRNLLGEARVRYPEDPDVWFTLGVARFTQDVQETWDGARAAFDRAIALDPSLAPAYVAPVQIALRDDDREAARRYVRGLLSVPGVDPDGAGMRLLGMLLEPGGGGRRAFDRALEGADPSVLARLALHP